MRWGFIGGGNGAWGMTRPEYTRPEARANGERISALHADAGFHAAVGGGDVELGGGGGGFLLA